MIGDEGVVFGDVKTLEVWVAGKPLSPERSLQLSNKSPSGFSWGYYGSGPAQLALAILLEFCDQETALNLYQLFKVEVLANQDINRDLALPIETIKTWLEQQKKCQQEGAINDEK